jgi:carboxymethylenebutenolidase
MPIYTARPDGDGKSPAVIVIQEIFGVNNDVRSIADRLANEGYFAAAPELFHRSGRGVDIPFSEMQQAFGERGKLSNDDITADVQATLDYLQSNPDVDADNIGIVGFCFGGMVSYLGATMSGIKAAAVYYGGGILPRPDAGPDAPRLLDDTADAVQAPIISFWGTEDAGIPVSNVEEIERVLKEKGKSVETHIYEGAGHGFFCSERGSYNEPASTDAWPKTLAFFGGHLK